MLNASVPMNGRQNARCSIAHGIRLIEDSEPSAGSGYSRRSRVSRLRRIDLGRRRKSTSTPETTAPQLVANGDAASASRAASAATSPVGQKTTTEKTVDTHRNLTA